MGKYFTTIVKPTMTASLQDASAMADDDLLFDWTSFDIPKGSSKLTGVTVLVRGTDGVRQEKSMDLYFAKTLGSGSTAPSSLGTINATVNGTGYYNHLIGAVHIDVADYKDGLDVMSIASAGHGASATQIPTLVLTGESRSGTNVGYDKLYIGGVAQGTLDFRSGLTDDGGHATSVSTITVADVSALIAFAKGDVIHDEDDNLLGTIDSITNATTIVFEDNLANASTNNKELYNLNPITIILSFEK